MLLSELAGEIGIGNLHRDCPVTGVTERLEQVQPGSLFCAVRGRKTDGHSLIEKAFRKGACAACVSKDSIFASRPDCLPVSSTREALGLLCRGFWGHPEKKMQVIAVTGTCGKSTVTHMLHGMLHTSAAPVGLIGTVICHDGVQAFPAHCTTPAPEELWPLLANMAGNGCRVCLMEASSQALEQGRMTGLAPAIGLFTNFSQDHLDVHGSLQAYFEAKCRLLHRSALRILGTDNSALSQLYDQLPGPKSSFGWDTSADFSASDPVFSPQGVSFLLREKQQKIPAFLPMVGRFSVENALAAVSVARSLHLPMEEIVASLAHYQPLPGRMEWISDCCGVQVMVDFAHTPASLEAAILALRPICKGRLLVLFGCGGDRDREKRPKMAAAATLSDRIYLTDDNPRTEDPLQIIRDLLPVLQAGKTPFSVIRPREAAIEQALEEARPGDILLLAGKGHETCQWLKHSACPMDEKALVRAYYQRRKERTR